MLSKPCNGWTTFQLEGTGAYSLSCLTDIPFSWLDRAVFGLEVMQSFSVTGSLEPGELTCTVRHEGCTVSVGEEETSCVDMLDFCRRLQQDLQQNLDAWAAFGRFGDPRVRRVQLQQKLLRLDSLICIRRSQFPADW